MHVHCGGWDSYNREYTRDCFAMEVGADPEVKVNAAASLPYLLASACHGSDGERLVVAGGWEGGKHYHDKVVVLEGVDAAWRTLPGRLKAPKRN